MNEAKYKIGDEVWVLKDFGLVKEKVYGCISILNGTYLYWLVAADRAPDNRYIWEQEKRLFVSKEELLEFLTNTTT